MTNERWNVCGDFLQELLLFIDLCLTTTYDANNSLESLRYFKMLSHSMEWIHVGDAYEQAAPFAEAAEEKFQMCWTEQPTEA